MQFEELESWQMARQLVSGVYRLTRDDALVRDFGVASQIQRAAVSIMSNVAEGFERRHVPEKLQAYNIARASAGEVRSLLYVIVDNYPSTAHSANALFPQVQSVGKLISGLIASTEARR